MPRVPQSDFVPDVSANPTPIPTRHIDAPLAAFGGLSAQATEQFGSQLQHSGDQIWQRAVDLQNLNNEAAAIQADAKLMTQVGERRTQYLTLEGNNAVAGQQQYNDDVQQMRNKIRSELPNDYARKLYDRSSLLTTSHAITAGSVHAASENKKFFTGANNSILQASKDQALLSPDDTAFAANLARTEAAVNNNAAIGGWSKEQTDQSLAKEISGVWSKRIEGIAQTDPGRAKDMLDDAIADGNIRGEDTAKITQHVQTKLHTVGARNISHDVTEGMTNPGAGVIDIKQAGYAIGMRESSGRYEAQGPVVEKGMYAGQRALGKYGIMPGNLPDFLKEAGLPPMTPAEFLKNPKAQDQVFETVFGRYMKETGSANQAASLWFTGKKIEDAPTGVNDGKTTLPEYLRTFNGYLARNMSLDDKVKAGTDIATKLAPDDPLFADAVRNRIESDHNAMHRIKADDAYNNRQVVEGALMGGQNGKIPTNTDELFAADPKVASAWNNLDDSTRRKYRDLLVRNAKGDSAWSDEGLRRYQSLKGMAATDPAEFLGTDVIAEKLPVSARRELASLQVKLKANAEGDPRVMKAMQVLGPELQAAGISKATNKDDYFQFVGTLQDALTDAQGEAKRPLKASEMREVGMRLLQQQTTKGWLWDSKTPTFQVPVPEAEAAKIKADPEWARIGVTPTDQQVQRIYTRVLYQKLYGTPKSSSSPAP